MNTMEMSYTEATERAVYNARRAIELDRAARCADAIAARGSAAEFRARAEQHRVIRNRYRAVRKCAVVGLVDRARGCGL